MIVKRPLNVLTPPPTPCMSRSNSDLGDYKWESAPASQPPTIRANIPLQHGFYDNIANFPISEPDRSNLEVSYVPIDQHQHLVQPSSRNAPWIDDSQERTNVATYSRGYQGRQDTRSLYGHHEYAFSSPAVSQQAGVSGQRAAVDVTRDRTAAAGYALHPPSQDAEEDDLDEQLNDDEEKSEASDEEEQADRQVPMTAAESLRQKRRMKRFRLNRTQTRFLVEEFAKYQHPDASIRQRLARQIPGLTPRQVQVWFQNRRAKLKRTMDNHEHALQSRAALASSNAGMLLPPHGFTSSSHSNTIRTPATLPPNAAESANMPPPQHAPARSGAVQPAQRHQSYPSMTQRPTGHVIPKTSPTETNPLEVHAVSQQQNNMTMQPAVPAEQIHPYPTFVWTSWPNYPSIEISPGSQHTHAGTTGQWHHHSPDASQILADQERRHTVPGMGTVGSQHTPVRDVSHPNPFAEGGYGATFASGQNTTDNAPPSIDPLEAGFAPHPGSNLQIIDPYHEQEVMINKAFQQQQGTFGPATAIQQPRMTYSEFLRSLQPGPSHHQQQHTPSAEDASHFTSVAARPQHFAGDQRPVAFASPREMLVATGESGVQIYGSAAWQQQHPSERGLGLLGTDERQFTPGRAAMRSFGGGEDAAGGEMKSWEQGNDKHLS